MKNRRSNTSFALGFSAVFLLILQLSVGLPFVLQATAVALVVLLAYHSWSQAKQIETLRLGQAVSAYASKQTRRRSQKSEMMSTIRL